MIAPRPSFLRSERGDGELVSAYQLAWDFGIWDVDGMLRRMGTRQWEKWQAYFRFVRKSKAFRDRVRFDREAMTRRARK